MTLSQKIVRKDLVNPLSKANSDGGDLISIK